MGERATSPVDVPSYSSLWFRFKSDYPVGVKNVVISFIREHSKVRWVKLLKGDSNLESVRCLGYVQLMPDTDPDRFLDFLKRFGTIEDAGVHERAKDKGKRRCHLHKTKP